MKPTSASDAPSTADTFNALNRALGDFGFDNESSAFISTSVLRQQSAFTLKLTQQRDAFEACIESFKCSAAAQMELQLVQLSVICPLANARRRPSAPCTHYLLFIAFVYFSHLARSESTRNRVRPSGQSAQ
jgi:hypothetical protein